MNKLAIILTTYNDESNQYFLECLNSLNNQEAPFKLIVVDDCSTDKTIEILKNNLKREYDLIINLTNLKLCAARFTGLTHLYKNPTEYIAFLDSDDSISENFVKTIHDLNLNKDYYRIYWRSYRNNRLLPDNKYKCQYLGNMSKFTDDIRSYFHYMMMESLYKVSFLQKHNIIGSNKIRSSRMEDLLTNCQILDNNPKLGGIITACHFNRNKRENSIVHRFRNKKEIIFYAHDDLLDGLLFFKDKIHKEILKKIIMIDHLSYYIDITKRYKDSLKEQYKLFYNTISDNFDNSWFCPISYKYMEILKNEF